MANLTASATVTVSMATTEPAVIQTLVLGGERFVILLEAEFARLVGEPVEPELPEALPGGNYPAVETARILLAPRLYSLAASA